jgi:hypothetical protein
MRKRSVIALPADAQRWDVAIAVPATATTLAAAAFLGPVHGRFKA